ncbi:NADP-dependent phosphogluconate dehydrogenase [Murdochiella vaginalis]|uniref:NADP-dependent phosphogluconate dehydrogenase n=1 Tax=Murdochiella vaginalis TaxID=1852373 RepID=UPI0008FEA2F6|nr:NADP-dependent phosphogluconate dehydrogenase [Murdochiella vaginalis]
MRKSRIGIIGLSVMGKGLALNMANNDFLVSVYNRTEKKTRDVIAQDHTGNLHGVFSLKEFLDSLESPKNILIMIKSGSAVDEMLDKLLPLLRENDLIIDGGNSHFKDTIRRSNYLEEKGIFYLGMGVSGGEKGALEGPAIMVGGNFQAYNRIDDVLEAISAKAEDGLPCCKYISDNGSGHFVKMIHNGIEYGDMQIIAEAVSIMKHLLHIDNKEMSEIFRQFNKGHLESYLIEITAQLLKEPDDQGEGFLVDKILDHAEQKGTGKWANLEAIDLGINTSVMMAGLQARMMSSIKVQRRKAAGIYVKRKTPIVPDKESLLKDLESALLAAKVMSYAQGFSLLRKGAQIYHWKFDYKEIASVFRAGCIIRADLLYVLMDEFSKNNELDNILLTESFSKILKNSVSGLRKIVVHCIDGGFACPAMSSAISYFDAFCTENSEANIIQAQRDLFGAHTFQRNDGKEGYFHHNWS